MKLVRNLANNRKALGILIFQGLYYFILIIVEDSHTLTPSGTVEYHTLTNNETCYQYGAFGNNFSGNTPSRDGIVTISWDSNNHQWVSKTANGWGVYPTTFYISFGSSWGHNHTFTGTQQTINHMNPYTVAYCFKRVL